MGGLEGRLEFLVNGPDHLQAAPSPLVVHEDEHLLVTNKPAGWNTHSPSPWAGEGLYEWLRNRERKWATLAIVHRLDKETSGLLVFTKSSLANKSLTDQFTRRSTRKQYFLVTDRLVEFDQQTVDSEIHKVGDTYAVSPPGQGSHEALTRFRKIGPHPAGTLVEAVPLTGRTHQIRVHAAHLGIPILGDTLYGGSPANRLHLHAACLEFSDPASGKTLRFSTPPRFEESQADQIRNVIIDPECTNAFRIRHGLGDVVKGLYLEQFADRLLCQSESPLTPRELEIVQAVAVQTRSRSVWHKALERQIQGKSRAKISPQQVSGGQESPSVIVKENGVRFEIRFNEGYSVGLFLDQRDNRRRVAANYVSPGFPIRDEGLNGTTCLNLFAYTCGFSVCAALAGARATSVDLSKKYLDWGRTNFAHNQCRPEDHDFLQGETFDWLRRFAKKGRVFDLVIADPPTFSQSKEHGSFKIDRDLSELAASAAAVVKPGGVLFLSTNGMGIAPEKFDATIRETLFTLARPVLQSHYQPQPPDFPVTRSEPAHLKSLWLRLGPSRP